MKSKISILFCIMASILTSAQTSMQDPIIISFAENLSKDQNVIGLNLVEIRIINVSEKVLKIQQPSYFSFEATFTDREKWINFSEGNLIRSTGNGCCQILEARDTMVFHMNLNLYEFLKTYFAFGGQEIMEPKEVKIRAKVYCYDEGQTYYSTIQKIRLLPLSKKDSDAFRYIQEHGFDPYSFTHLYKMKGKMDSTIANAVLTRYPKSTFAELASLSLAYKEARESVPTPEHRANILRTLKKPLASRHSFVRYLAEELKKSY